MLDFLVQIAAYACAALIILSFIGLVIWVFGIWFSLFSSKKNNAPFGALPWWVWWTTTRDD